MKLFFKKEEIGIREELKIFLVDWSKEVLKQELAYYGL